MKSNSIVFVSACSLITAWGCAAQPKNNPDASFSEIKQAELSDERREFIQDTQKSLEQVDHDLALTQAKLDHESQFVSKEQRAEWSQQIFELKQEHQRLTGELQRAKTADEAEWKEMRGSIAVGVDSLQAAATKVGNTVANAFEAKPELASNEGLCPLDVGKTDAKVEGNGQAVVVDVTVDDPKSVTALRDKAAELAHNTKRYPATETAQQNHENVSSRDNAIPVALATENIEEGVRVTFTPAASQQLSELEQRLNGDAKALEEDRCKGGDSKRVSVR